MPTKHFENVTPLPTHMWKQNCFFISPQWLSAAVLLAILLNSPVNAYEISDEFSAVALVLGVFQYGIFENNFDNDGRRIADQGNGFFGIDLELD